MEKLLGKTESKLVQVRSKYEKDRNSMQTSINNLESTIKKSEESLSDAQKKQNVYCEKYEKYKKRVESLEQYLGDLPTMQETTKLKRDLSDLASERETLAARFKLLEDQLSSRKKVCKDLESKLNLADKREHSYKEQIENLESTVSDLQKAKDELGFTEQDELKVLFLYVFFYLLVVMYLLITYQIIVAKSKFLCQ